MTSSRTWRVASPRFDPVALTDIQFDLPEALGAFGGIGRATLVGADGAPVIAMLGGISANRFPCVCADGSPGWWSGLAGEGKAVDPARHRILGIDFIADPTGRRAPSPADQAAVLQAALDAFGIAAAHTIVGASYGGMIALAFAELFPAQVGKLIVISADGSPHPTATANRELQRRVVRFGLDAGRGEEGLAIARGMAMLTYRCPDEFAERFVGGIDGHDPLTCSGPGGYLRARGTAYSGVMTPERFLGLSASIDRHFCSPELIATPALLIGAISDQLIPPESMRNLSVQLAGPAQLHLLPSLYGHDMFLKEADRVGALVADFL